MTDNHDDRIARGKARMRELFGPNWTASASRDDFMEITVGHLFGDVWTREGLELRERSMITCAALMVMGKEPQLKVHLRGALHVGISKEAIEEMVIHLAHYAGWPVSVNALRVAREVFEESET
ncbi:MAG: carboxymuconolactone decarboxylase family protein [Proteobacteria bacterium]|nr:carboxymuconolactone decarboxylase family protein [Pseudomonadota bacterium]